MKIHVPAPLLVLFFLMTFATALFGTETMVLNEGDTGREITVVLNTVIEIQLQEVGAAGYAWEFENLDGDHLEILRSETRLQKKEGLTGAPVTRIWCLKAKKKGKTELRMNYYRPWEGKEKAVSSFELRILIR